MSCFCFKQKSNHSYSFTDNVLSPITVSDWLLFNCGNLHFIKKRNKNDNIVFEGKQKLSKKYM